MKTGKLKITVKRPDGTPTVYEGEAEWRTDSTTMKMVAGEALEGFDHGRATMLEVHAMRCRIAATDAGMEVHSEWIGDFRGGILR